MKIKICLLVRSLNLGGAQRQIVALARGLDPLFYRVTVLTFYPGGAFAEALRHHPHIDVHCLHKHGRWDLLTFFWRTLLILRRMKPDVIYGFLGGGNVVASLCRPFLGNVRVLWGVRNSVRVSRDDHWAERLTACLEVALSHQPQAILCNSQAGMVSAAARGFPPKKLYVVPNGIDGELFQPSPSAVNLRDRWGGAPTEILLGLVGRADPLKDHLTCFLAVKLLRQMGYPVRLFLVGFGQGVDEAMLRKQAEDAGVGEWCGWETVQTNMSIFYSAIDLLVLSSVSEGFPNVVAEAMACGTPCVVTDVGDAALLVGMLGEVVPARDPEALASGIARMLTRLRESSELRHEVRASILRRFSVETMVAQTAALFRQEDNGVSGREQGCASST